MTEIADYLRPTRVVWAFIAAVVVAAVVVGAIITLPVEPEVKTVAVVGPDHFAASANDRIDFIRNLQAAAETSTVLDTVAERSGLSRQQLEDGLRVKRIESSNLVQISYQTTDRDAEAATTVVLTVPEAAVGFLRLTIIEEATARLDEATADLVTATAVVADAAQAVVVAEAEVVAAVVANDNIRPDVTFAALQNEIAALRIRRASTDAEESPVLAEQLDETIATLEAQLPEAAISANLFGDLLATQEVAVDAHETAVKAQEDALAEAEDAQEAYDLATTLPKASLQAVEQEVGQLWPGLRQIAAIGAAALLLAVGLAIAWTMVFGRDRSDAGPKSPLLADDADDDVFSKGKKRGAQPATAKVASKTSSAGKAGAPAKGPAKNPRQKKPAGSPKPEPSDQ